MQDAEGPIVLWAIGIMTMVGLAIGISSYITWSKRWPGMIAGFDRNRCSDVDGITRWVGGAGMFIGGAVLLAAAAFVVPRFRVPVVIALPIVGLVGVVVTTSGCQRFTRR